MTTRDARTSAGDALVPQTAKMSTAGIVEIAESTETVETGTTRTPGTGTTRTPGTGNMREETTGTMREEIASMREETGIMIDETTEIIEIETEIEIESGTESMNEGTGSTRERNPVDRAIAETIAAPVALRTAIGVMHEAADAMMTDATRDTMRIARTTTRRIESTI
jgi:hypothetical protein